MRCDEIFIRPVYGLMHMPVEGDVYGRPVFRPFAAVSGCDHRGGPDENGFIEVVSKFQKKLFTLDIIAARNGLEIEFLLQQAAQHFKSGI